MTLPILTPLAESHGFIAGSLDTSGYVAMVSAYQKVYFADGRRRDAFGFHKLDFISTKLTGLPSAAFTVGETVFDVDSSSVGVYVENPDRRIYGTATGTFSVGELVTQAVSGAKGIIHAKATETLTALYVYPIYGTFVVTSLVTGATSNATMPPTSVGPGKYHLVYRTTTDEFGVSAAITGATSTSTLTPTAVTAPPHWLPWAAKEGYEGLPEGGSNIGALCFGRLFLNDMWHPNQWYASRMGGTQPEGASEVIDSTCDWLVGQDDIGSPVSSQASKAGLVGDAITALISYKDDFLVLGCANSVWVLRGDPCAGGILTRLTDSTGVFSQSSWCWDDKNTLYFVGTDGLYSLSTDAIIQSSSPENLTRQQLPTLITGLNLNRRTDTVCLGFDKERYGVQFSASMNDGAWNASFWFSLITGGVFPLSFPVAQTPMSMLYFNSYNSSNRGLFIGGADGYIRKYDLTAKDDITAAGVAVAITSHAYIGPILAPDDITKEPALTQLDLAIGANSDPITVNQYSSCYSAERLVHSILDESEYPRSTKVFSTSARHPIMLQGTKRRAIALKLGNDTVGESWYIENFNIKAK